MSSFHNLHERFIQGYENMNSNTILLLAMGLIPIDMLPFKSFQTFKKKFKNVGECFRQL